MNKPIPLPGYDRALELKLAEGIVTAIAAASKVDGVLVLRPAEVTVALIANLGFMLAREPAAVEEPAALAHTLAAIERLLLRHIASAVRAKNARSNGGAAK